MGSTIAIMRTSLCMAAWPLVKVLLSSSVDGILCELVGTVQPTQEAEVGGSFVNAMLELN